jgi:hypothetical protein
MGCRLWRRAMSYAVLALLVVVAPCAGDTQPHGPIVGLQEMVRMLAVEQGVDAERALETVRLESQWDPSAVGDEGDAVGLWQWHGAESVNTWAWACELTGHAAWADDANRADALKSTIVALDMIAAGWGHLWTGWREQEGT